MIVDFHTHTYPDKIQETKKDAKLQIMKKMREDKTA